jgi:hypothetical protein
MLHHVPEENESCTELNKAFAEGTWFCPDALNPLSSSVEEEATTVPLHQLATAYCVLRRGFL